MKQIICCAFLFMGLLISGCKEDSPVPPAKSSQPPASPQTPVSPQKVEPAKKQQNLPSLIQNAEDVCRALEKEELSFDVQQAAETMCLLRENKQNQDALNAFAELSAALRIYWRKLRDDNSSTPPDIRIQSMATLLPLLKEMDQDYEYKDALFQIKKITGFLVSNLTNAYGSNSRDYSDHERRQQRLLTALAVYDEELQDMAADFWAAEKEKDFAKCVSIWAQTAEREAKKHDEIVEAIRNLMATRLHYWREIFERQFWDASDIAVKKAALQTMKTLMDPNDQQSDWARRYGYMNEEYRKKLEEASKQQPVPRRREPPQRPRSREEAEQQKHSRNIIRAIASGQPAMLNDLLAKGTSAERVRINGKSPYSFLLDCIQRGRRVEQSKIMIQILMQHGVKATDDEMALIREVMPKTPVAEK